MRQSERGAFDCAPFEARSEQLLRFFLVASLLLACRSAAHRFSSTSIVAQRAYDICRMRSIFSDVRLRMKSPEARRSVSSFFLDLLLLLAS